MAHDAQAHDNKALEKPADCTLGHALGAVAVTAVDQAHALAVAQLDRWAHCLRQQLDVPAAQEDTPVADESADAPAADAPCISTASCSTGISAVATPLIAGALAGVAVAWLLAGRRTET